MNVASPKRPAVVTAYLAAATVVMLVYGKLGSHGVPVPDQALEEIVDEVPLLLSPPPPTAGRPATPSAAR